MPRLTTDEARTLLETFREIRDGLPEAIAVCHQARIPKSEIVRLSGLSRSGVDKILARNTTKET